MELTGMGGVEGSQVWFAAFILLMLHMPVQPFAVQTTASAVVVAVVFSVCYCFHV